MKRISRLTALAIVFTFLLSTTSAVIAVDDGTSAKDVKNYLIERIK